MRPGPRPKPSALKALAGYPGKTKKRNGREPDPPKGAPECPAHLAGEALAEWNRKVSQLSAMGVLTKVDGNALARYCDWWSIYVECMRFIRENGKVQVVRDDKGVVKYTKPTDQIQIALKTSNEMRALEAEFGLTPASRTRLEIVPQREPNEWDSLAGHLERSTGNVN